MTPVKGLQDTPGGPAGTDMTDQSMSVLLPPAQSQKVLLAGGGNINYERPATRLTDLIDLATADPHYTAGPLIPRGKLSNGKLESPGEGKMYVSLVILPNGQVFETGGGLVNREEPVYEASMYNPAANTFTPGMAADPVPRGYHSSAFLLPDGRVMAIGNNPGNGSFDMRISVYSPPYLFNGPRPQITRRGDRRLELRCRRDDHHQPEDRLRRADQACRGHPLLRPQPAVRRAAADRPKVTAQSG